MTADKLLGMAGQVAPSIETSSTVFAGGNCSGSYWAAVSLAWPTANCLDSGSARLSVPHPVVEAGLASRDVHDHHLVLSTPSVLAGNIRDQEDITPLPRPPPSRVIVDRLVYLFSQKGYDVLRSL